MRGGDEDGEREMTETSCESVSGAGGRSKVTPAHFKDQRSHALGQELRLQGAISQELQR